MLLLLLLEIFFGYIDYVLIARAFLELKVQFNHTAIAGVGDESMDIVILTGRHRAAILVDVRVLLEMVNRDPVDVDRGLGVSTAASGSVASFTIVETVVVAIAIMGQHGCAGSGNGWIDGGWHDDGNQMIVATIVRPLMLEKLLRCRHIRIRADSY